jgi:hypothetical protein
MPNDPHANALQSPAGVPVARVVLFSSGVGFFEHAGSVSGDSSTELRFKSEQINDILTRSSPTKSKPNGSRSTTTPSSPKTPSTAHASPTPPASTCCKAPSPCWSSAPTPATPASTTSRPASTASSVTASICKSSSSYC